MSTALAPAPVLENGQNPMIPTQAKDDSQLLSLWLNQHSVNTRRAYAKDVEGFFDRIGKKSLRLVTIGDVQAFGESCSTLSPASVSRKLAALKSLFSFAAKIGYVSFNVGVAVSLPKKKDDLTARILTKTDVCRMITLEPNARNQAVIETLYCSGARISELVGMNWSDINEADGQGLLTLFGKGGKTRVVRIPSQTLDRLVSLTETKVQTEPVFLSQFKTRLSTVQVHRIVAKAANRAGIDKHVSAHWLRHAHASHALDKGAPVHLVQATLGHASLATTTRYVHAKPNDSSGLYLLD